MQIYPPKIGTITRQSVDEWTYVSPHGIAHASVPVTLHFRVVVTHGAGVPFGVYETTKVVHVIRKKWRMNVEFRLDIACGGGNTDYGYAYADDRDQDFHLEDNPSGFSLVADPTLAGVPEDATVTKCTCAPSLAGPAGPLVIDYLGGSFLPHVRGQGVPHFQLSGFATMTNMIPVIEYVCPNPVPPPATLTYRSDPVDYSFDLLFGLNVFGGVRPSDGTQKYILLEPPLLAIVITWRSIAD